MRKCVTLWVHPEDWQLYTFGSGECGRLGHGDDVDRLVPTPVAALEGKPVLDVALGDHHSLVLVGELAARALVWTCIADSAPAEPASVYAWGWGATGALGQGNTADAWSPTLVEALQGKSVCSISAGAAHSVALTGAPAQPHRSCLGCPLLTHAALTGRHGQRLRGVHLGRQLPRPAGPDGCRCLLAASAHRHALPRVPEPRQRGGQAA